MPFQVRFLEDIAIADMAFEVTADSPTELFTAATEAMIESLADPATIGRTWQHEVDREAIKRALGGAADQDPGLYDPGDSGSLPRQRHARTG